MVVKRLIAMNVKRLREVNLVPPEVGLVIVAGDNAQGKSSVLDTIPMVLAGAKFSPEKPIREGEARASATVDLGDCTVRRVWTPGNSYLEVTDKDGAKVGRPQEWLNRLVGPLSFDPERFTHLPPREQAAILATLAGLDFSEAEADKAEALKRRLVATQMLQAADRDVAALPPGWQDAPEEEVSVAELSKQLSEAHEANETRRAAIARRSELERAVGEREMEIHELETRLQERRALLAHSQQVAAEARAVAESLAPVDAEAIQAGIEEAEQTNARVRARKVGVEKLAKRLQYQSDLDRADAELASIAEWRAEQIAAAKFPVPGIGYTEDGVTYQGRPLSQCANSEQLRVAVGAGLAMSQGVKVVLIHDGSLLDAANIDMIDQMARDAGAQVWVERVGMDENATWIIEDGKAFAKMDWPPDDSDEDGAAVDVRDERQTSLFTEDHDDAGGAA